jgi:catechol 2,3-dioxygenase-like lactoylglutathione lyase family enzyme
MRSLGKAIVAAFAIIGVVASVQHVGGQNVSPFAGQTPTHVGVIVHDIEKTSRMFHDVFGVTVPPIQTSQRITWPENPAGPDVAWRVRLTTLRLGTLAIELVQPLEGAGPHRAHLERFGQGLHHLAFAVADRSAAFAFLKSKGGTQASSTYVDLKDQLGMTVEIAPGARPAQ